METGSFRMIAQTLHGLEDVLRTELVKLGARDTERHNRAVSFTGDLGFLYKANFMLRTAVRVLVPIASFQARNAEEFYMGVKRIRWDAHMANTDTFLIKCNLNARWADNSQFLALKAKMPLWTASAKRPEGALRCISTIPHCASISTW